MQCQCVASEQQFLRILPQSYTHTKLSLGPLQVQSCHHQYKATLINKSYLHQWKATTLISTKLPVPVQSHRYRFKTTKTTLTNTKLTFQYKANPISRKLSLSAQMYTIISTKPTLSVQTLSVQSYRYQQKGIPLSVQSYPYQHKGIPLSVQSYHYQHKGIPL